MIKSIFPTFLHESVDDVARKLLGCVLERELDGYCIRLRIVETESYDEDDEASHAFGGMTKRNHVMFGGAGHLYVYFTYGLHYCCNIVTGEPGYGSGVLIRAGEPIEGIELLERRRGKVGINVTNGPAKLAAALGIDFALSGHDLQKSPLRLVAGMLRSNERITTSPRIGISRAKDVHRRYYIQNNPYVSHQKIRRKP